MISYAGVDTASPINASGVATSASKATSHVAPSVTTTALNTALISIHGMLSGTTLTPRNGHERALGHRFNWVERNASDCAVSRRESRGHRRYGHANRYICERRLLG